MTGPPKIYNEIMIAAPTPSFLERGDLTLSENLGEFINLANKNNFWRRNTVFVRIEQAKKPSELIREISDMGYARHIGDLHKGEFFQQGGFITIYPINSEAPITIEFSGNIIELIREAKIILHQRHSVSFIRHRVSNIQEGDYVVHEDHGIGIYRGKNEKRFLILEYAPARKGGDPDRLLVPE